MGISSGMFWLNSFLATQVVPLILSSPLQTHGYFYVISFLSVFYIIFTLLALPETKVSGSIARFSGIS